MFCKHRLPIIALLVASLLAVNGALPVLGQGPDLYPGTWTSGISIKNLTNDNNQVEVIFYNANTGQQEYSHPLELGPRASVELYLPNDLGALPAGQYSVEVQSAGPVGVTADNSNYDANISDAYNAMEAAASYFVPGFYHGLNDYASQLMVQNTGEQEINVSIEVSGIRKPDDTPVGPVTFGPLKIPAHSTRAFDTGTNAPFNFDSKLGAGFVGSAKVTNAEDRPMAVMLLNTRVRNDLQISAGYRGLSIDADADTFLVAPLVYKNYNNCWRSTVTVQSVDGSNPLDVKLTIRSADPADRRVWTSTQTLGPGKSFEWYLPYATFTLDGKQPNQPLPDQFRGYAVAEVVSGSGKIVGTSLNTNLCRAKQLTTGLHGRGMALSYIMQGRSTGKSTVTAPILYKNFGPSTRAWVSSFIVCNTGEDPVTFDLAIASDPTSNATYNKTLRGYTLAPGESKEFYTPRASDFQGNVIPDGFKGSMLVTATSGSAKLSGVIQLINNGRGVARGYIAPGQ